MMRICIVGTRRPRLQPSNPTADRPPLLFDGACPCLGSIFVTSHVLANVANAPPVAGSRRPPPRRFVSSIGRSDYICLAGTPDSGQVRCCWDVSRTGSC